MISLPGKCRIHRDSFMKYLLHYGIQRSSTNYLEELVIRNYRVRFLNDDTFRDHPLHKHFRLYDNKKIIADTAFSNDLHFKDFSGFTGAMELSDEPAGILVISKDPYSWLISYRRWAKKFNWSAVDFHYIEEYNLFYGKWMQFAREDPRILFIRYDELLEDPRKVLKIIEEQFGLELKRVRKLAGRKVNLSKVARSRRFNRDRRIYYLQKGYLSEFDEASLKEVNMLLDQDLMGFMGYPVIDRAL